MPSICLNFMPRMRPVMPATLMIAPDANDWPSERTNGFRRQFSIQPTGLMVGKTISLAVQPICVRWPW